jgi:eukaryotic-like serine/threonine-protein kinase
MPVEAATFPERYSDPKLVARGGMGEVYCATDTSLSRPVAIKLLAERYAADTAVRARFTREALAAARLNEPNIVTIFDVGEWDGHPFIAMEYLPGGTLDDVLRKQGAQPPAQALEWLEQAARALDHAHEKGVVHRDVKPANLLLDGSGRVHVADFGVAIAAGLDSVTMTGTVIGTAGYLSPEQAEGREATPASDRYGLGIVAYELLVGTRPFARTSPTEEAVAHVREPVPAASEQRRGLPREIDDVFARALAKNPAQRYSTCGEFVADLRRAFAHEAGRTQIVAVAGRRRRPLLLPLALLALLVGAGIATAVVLTGRSNHAAPPARVTITQQGTTVRETVTARAAPPPPTATTSPTGGGASAAQQGYAKMTAGDYAGALPLLEQAAQQLQGDGTTAEAYNDYNLAFTLANTQGCSSRVLQLLDASQSIQGHRTEIDQLRKACRKAS